MSRILRIKNAFILVIQKILTILILTKNGASGFPLQTEHAGQTEFEITPKG